MHTLLRADILAYLDWAGMRPLTKLELEKMCRGPIFPVAHEYAWGTSGYIDAGNILNDGTSSETFDNVGTDPIWPSFGSTEFQGARAGFAATDSSTRLSSGATYYGVMDVHSGGTSFFLINGTIDILHYYNGQGDGMLAMDGNANVLDWSEGSLITMYSFSHHPISHGEFFIIGPRTESCSFRGVVRLQP